MLRIVSFLINFPHLRVLRPLNLKPKHTFCLKFNFRTKYKKIENFQNSSKVFVAQKK